MGKRKEKLTPEDKEKKQNNSTEAEATPQPTGAEEPGRDEKTAEEAAIEKPEENEVDKITALSDQLAAEKDRVLRLSAEFENYKKRKERELSEFKKFANESVFKSLLTVVDNLERAIDAAKEAPDVSRLLEGVELTHKDISKLFETFGVTLINAHHEPFDPNFHQAVTQEATDQVPENHVTTVLQNGYLLHDRLIRPAMVVVSKKLEETEQSKDN